MDGTSGNSSFWTRERRAHLVIRILRGETSAEKAAAAYGVALSDVQAWQEELVGAMHKNLPLWLEGDSVTDSPQPRETGVWIWATAEDFLLPSLFMEGICADRVRSSASARWVGTGQLPERFEEAGGLPLSHAICEHGSWGGAALHLFTSKHTYTTPFYRRSLLSDWEFPVRVRGIVALVQNRPPHRSLRRPAGTSRPVEGGFAWVMQQGVPFVVGAMGQDENSFSARAFRERFALPPQVPLLPGPGLARRRRPAGRLTSPVSGGESSVAALLGLGSLRFDPDYAKQLIRLLFQEMRIRIVESDV